MRTKLMDKHYLLLTYSPRPFDKSFLKCVKVLMAKAPCMSSYNNFHFFPVFTPKTVYFNHQSALVYWITSHKLQGTIEMYFIIFNNVVFRLFLFVVVLLIIFSMNDISIIWVGHLEMYVCNTYTELHGSHIF